MRQCIDSVKPDVHLHRFAETALHRKLSDHDVVEVVTRAAVVLGVKAYELDWSIRESQRSKGDEPCVASVDCSCVVRGTASCRRRSPNGSSDMGDRSSSLKCPTHT